MLYPGMHGMQYFVLELLRKLLWSYWKQLFQNKVVSEGIGYFG